VKKLQRRRHSVPLEGVLPKTPDLRVMSKKKKKYIEKPRGVPLAVCVEDSPITVKLRRITVKTWGLHLKGEKNQEEFLLGQF